MIAGMATRANRGHEPTPAQIRAAREAAELTQEKAAELVHATWRTWQNWEAQGAEGRQMPRGLFELFMLKTKYPDVIAQLLQGMRKK